MELAALLGASRAVELQTDTAADLVYLLGPATSLGGLRPKCSVLDDDGSLAIGKFPSVSDERSIPHGEVLALSLARTAGIDAATARIVHADGTPVALIRRFDRTAQNVRLLYISAATLLGSYDPEAQPTYTQIVDALRQHGSRPQADIDELFRRIAFSILITNIDDHLRNHGFLHEEFGRFRLSPAFDVNPFPDRARELKTWISEETGPDASIEALLSVAAYFRVPRDKAHRIVREVERAVATWRATGKTLGMIDRDLDAFEAAFEHRERTVAEALPDA
jgi:serine/threonine-protein kinase HipA